MSEKQVVRPELKFFLKSMSIEKKLEALDKAIEWLRKNGFITTTRDIVRVARFLVEIPFPSHRKPIHTMKHDKKAIIQEDK